MANLALFKENYKLVLFAGLYDILFFVFYGFIASSMLLNVNRGAAAIMQSAAAGSLNSAHLINAVFYSLIFALAFYLLYCLFQGMAWICAYKILKKKLKLRRFFQLNLLWIPLVFLLFTFQYIRRLSAFITQANTRLGDNIFLILFIVLVYLIIISYSSNSFSVKNAKKLENLKLALIIAAVFIAINFILQYTLQWPFLNIALGFALVIPALTWARVEFIEKNL